MGSWLVWDPVPKNGSIASLEQDAHSAPQVGGNFPLILSGRICPLNHSLFLNVVSTNRFACFPARVSRGIPFVNITVFNSLLCYFQSLSLHASSVRSTKTMPATLQCGLKNTFCLFNFFVTLNQFPCLPWGRTRQGTVKSYQQTSSTSRLISTSKVSSAPADLFCICICERIYSL